MAIMSYSLYFILLAVQLTSISATQPLPLKCFLQDNNFLTLFNKGNVRTNPDDGISINFPTLDKLKVDHVKVDRDGFLFEAKDVEIEGLQNAIVDDFGINLVNNISHLTFHTDLLAKCLYKADGSVLFLPINGEGYSIVSLKNIQFSIVVPFDIVDKDGKKYFELMSYDYWYDVIDDANISFSNLYYGDTLKSYILHYVLNQNWKFMIGRYGPIFVTEFTKSFFNMLKNYFLSTPLTDFGTC